MKTSAMFLALALAATACAKPAPVRFANAPAVTVVDDRRDTPTPPAPRAFARTLYHIHGNLIRRITRALELPRAQRARGVNALDEVPDSTWFTNRIGVRELSLDEIRRGPAVVGSPEGHGPWTVKSTKVGGASLGFVITDARGERFVLKFDERGFPELETGTDAIVSRLVWALGYNVPEDHVVYFRPSDLVVAPGAKIKDVFGNARPLTRAALDQMLARVEHEPDGRIRGLASRMLDGTWLGGHPVEGVRADDPNDRIPHELRRDLRGLEAIFAWLDHIDVKEDNFLDMWVADPEDPSHHYVKHYILDLGKALGAMGAIESDPRRGHTYLFDAADMLGSLVTLGLHERSWIGRTSPGIRGVGVLDVTHYDPGAWKPYNATYMPFHTADRFDALWGSKLVMRFTREQLRAAVETARFTDPRAVDYITELLVARQRATARYWFERTPPLDAFELRATAGGPVLCFTDLLLSYELAPVARHTRYELAVEDRAGRTLVQRGPSSLAPGPDGRTCSAPLALASDGDGYSVVTVTTQRRPSGGTTQVHVARTSGVPRVVGIWRE